MNEDMLASARAELAEKPRLQIEQETAYRWAARAVAARQNYDRTRDLRWLHDSADYLHEAIEHAALADFSGTVLLRVRQWVHVHGLH